MVKDQRIKTRKTLNLDSFVERFSINNFTGLSEKVLQEFSAESEHEINDDMINASSHGFNKGASSSGLSGTPVTLTDFHSAMKEICTSFSTMLQTGLQTQSKEFHETLLNQSQSHASNSNSAISDNKKIIDSINSKRTYYL